MWCVSLQAGGAGVQVQSRLHSESLSKQEQRNYIQTCSYITCVCPSVGACLCVTPTNQSGLEWLALVGLLSGEESCLHRKAKVSCPPAPSFRVTFIPGWTTHELMFLAREVRACAGIHQMSPRPYSEHSLLLAQERQVFIFISHRQLLMQLSSPEPLVSKQDAWKKAHLCWKKKKQQKKKNYRQISTFQKTTRKAALTSNVINSACDRHKENVFNITTEWFLCCFFLIVMKKIWLIDRNLWSSEHWRWRTAFNFFGDSI